MTQKKKKDEKANDQTASKFVKLLKGLKGLGDSKFKIKGTEFSVTKLPIMDGFDMAEKIRVTMAETANRFEDNSTPGKSLKEQQAQNANLFFKVLLGLPTDFVKELRDKMFEYIQFRGGKSGVSDKKGWAPLADCKDAAFQDFEIIHIYEVLGRALYVNFSGSFSGILSAIPGAEQILKQLNLEI